MFCIYEIFSSRLIASNSSKTQNHSNPPKLYIINRYYRVHISWYFLVLKVLEIVRNRNFSHKPIFFHSFFVPQIAKDFYLYR